MPESLPRRLLIVEDDPHQARLLRQDLAQFETPPKSELAATLGEALEKLSEPFDLVLLDLGLPDADDLEALTSVREKAPRTPVLILSGQDDVEVALRAMQSGAQEYLVKGQASGSVLARAMRYAMERQRQQDFERLLLGIASHDLRAPLHAARMALELAADDVPEATRGAVQQGLRAIDRAHGLVRDLLDVTQVRLRGALPVELEHHRIDRLVAGVVEECRAAGASMVRVASSEPVEAEVDPDRVAQAVTNLVRNAVQHGASDHREGVVVECVGRDDAVVVSVRDHGPGIPETLRDRLFEPFEHHSPDGVGLGLFIASQVARAHGGEIACETSPSGTTFLLRLPRQRAGAPVREA